MLKKKLIVNVGERAVICGKTGSGKTTLMYSLILYSLSFPVIIFDTKVDETFNKLPYYKEVEDIEDVFLAITKEPVILYRPHPADIRTGRIDAVLQFIYENVRNCYVYIDEAFQMHYGNQVLDGYLNILMRGRTRKIACISGIQRPRQISRFILTEANKFYIFNLQDFDDRKRLYEVIPDEKILEEIPEKYHFWFFEGQNFTLEDPIEISEKEIDKFYKDAIEYRREKLLV